MSGSLDGIKRVIAAFERSDWTEIDVRSGDVRLHLSTGTASDAPLGPTSAPGAAEPPVAGAAPDGDDRTVADPRSPRAASANPTATAGAHVVVAPSPGIFWRSPEPGAPPFAALDAAVDASTTVCIVEVMKLMNHVKAGVTGTVVAVYGEDGVAVQKGDPLFAITPAGSAS